MPQCGNCGAWRKHRVGCSLAEADHPVVCTYCLAEHDQHTPICPDYIGFASPPSAGHPEPTHELNLAPKNPNPKDSIGSAKIPMHLWPETATLLGCMGLLDGALKYGRSNYRVAPVRASIYYDAAKRHINGWFEGRPCDPDSGLPDMAHALACLAIIVDAEAAGTLIDDRNVKGGYHRLIADMTPHVKRLQETHADKSPQHHTIRDNA